MSINRPDEELFVEKYYNIPADKADERLKIPTDYGDLVNLLTMFKEELLENRQMRNRFGVKSSPCYNYERMDLGNGYFIHYPEYGMLFAVEQPRKLGLEQRLVAFFPDDELTRRKLKRMYPHAGWRGPKQWPGYIHKQVIDFWWNNGTIKFTQE
jgi:hypothetical protein